MVCSSFEEGSIKMINVQDMQTLFILTWLANLQQTSDVKWTLILKSILKQLGKNLLCLKAPITSTHFFGIQNIYSKFWQQSLIKWLQNKYYLFVERIFLKSLSLEKSWLDLHWQSIVLGSIDCCWCSLCWRRKTSKTEMTVSVQENKWKLTRG